MMCRPTVDRFFGMRLAVFFAGPLVLVFVFIAPPSSRSPARRRAYPFERLKASYDAKFSDNSGSTSLRNRSVSTTALGASAMHHHYTQSAYGQATRNGGFAAAIISIRSEVDQTEAD
jgi:hypothetical protein